MNTGSRSQQPSSNCKRVSLEEANNALLVHHRSSVDAIFQAARYTSHYSLYMSIHISTQVCACMCVRRQRVQQQSPKPLRFHEMSGIEDPEVIYASDFATTSRLREFLSMCFLFVVSHSHSLFIYGIQITMTHALCVFLGIQYVQTLSLLRSLPIPV